jgi:hypothetical protein
MDPRTQTLQALREAVQAEKDITRAHDALGAYIRAYPASRETLLPAFRTIQTEVMDHREYLDSLRATLREM